MFSVNVTLVILSFKGGWVGIKVLTTRRLTRPPKIPPSGREMKASCETHESVPTPQLPEKKKMKNVKF